MTVEDENCAVIISLPLPPAWLADLPPPNSAGNADADEAACNADDVDAAGRTSTIRSIRKLSLLKGFIKRK